MKFETLSLTTRDLERARTFYERTLGFPVVAEAKLAWFKVDVGGVKLHVDAAEPARPLTGREPRLTFHTDDLPSRCRTLRDQGISVEGPRKGAEGMFAQL